MNTYTAVYTVQYVLIAGLTAFAACTGNDAPPPAKTMTCPPGMSQAARQNICIPDLCGNAIIDTGESCDDGNRIAGDGCSLDCQSTEICGNGIVDNAIGEVCDDGNTASGDTCCSDCRSCPEQTTLPSRLAAATPEPPATAPSAAPSMDALPSPQLHLEQEPVNSPTNLVMAPVTQPTTPAAQTNREARRGYVAVPNAASRDCSAEEQQIRAQADTELQRARNTIAELERTNSALKQSLAAERLLLAELRKSLISGRSTELQ